MKAKFKSWWLDMRWRNFCGGVEAEAIGYLDPILIGDNEAFRRKVESDWATARDIGADMRWINCINRDKIKTNSWNIPIMIGDSEERIESAMRWKEEVMRLTNE